MKHLSLKLLSETVISRRKAMKLSQAALSDKKRRGGSITLVLPERVGQCALKTVPVEELPAYFRRGTGADA